MKILTVILAGLIQTIGVLSVGFSITFIIVSFIYNFEVLYLRLLSMFLYGSISMYISIKLWRICRVKYNIR